MKTKPIYATGRRKTSTARVYCTQVDGDGKITVNGREFTDYFPRKTAQQIIMQPLGVAKKTGGLDFNITVRGGGITGQAGAVLLGISRTLEKVNGSLRPTLKRAGFLTRDPRAVERKKPGRHKARRSTQYSKR